MLDTHLDPTRYVDAQAYRAYERHKGHELVVAECVVGAPAQVFDAWLEQVWLARGAELRAGRGRGHVGHVRSAPLGIEEEILSAGLPMDSSPVDSSPDGRPSRAAAERDRFKIPSICYKMRKFGLWFPMQSHLAFVQFVDVAASPKSTPATLIIWSLKTTPSALGYLLCCGGFTKLLLRSALQSMLKDLATSAAAATHRYSD